MQIILTKKATVRGEVHAAGFVCNLNRIDAMKLIAGGCAEQVKQNTGTPHQLAEPAAPDAEIEEMIGRDVAEIPPPELKKPKTNKRKSGSRFSFGK